MNAGDEQVFAEQRESFGRISGLIDEAESIVICAPLTLTATPWGRAWPWAS